MRKEWAGSRNVPKDEVLFWVADRRFEGETVFIICSGPSLSGVDLGPLRNSPIIAVNNSFRAIPAGAPKAILYFCDLKWWGWYGKDADYLAWDRLIVSQEKEMRSRDVRVKIVNASGPDGLDLRPWCVKTGKNGGYQALNLAVNMGARRIVFFGLDMGASPDGRVHWHKEHERPTPAEVFGRVMLPKFEAVAPSLEMLGIEVFNASEFSHLEAFPKITQERAFSWAT